METVRIRDGKKSGTRDKHPGSATLPEAYIRYFIWRCIFLNCSAQGLNVWGGEYVSVTLCTRPLFWAHMALASLVDISGPEKVSISGPTPSNGPRNRSCPHQNHYIPRHINNRYINSYWEILHFAKYAQ
jgi:hypothetical protein